MKKKIFLQKIHKNFPNIKFDHAQLISSGYDNDVIVLDKRIIFSFPKLKYDCLKKPKGK